MYNRFPVFIPTKGRYKRPYTIRALEDLGIFYYAVVEPHEYDLYKEIVNNGEILITPHKDKGLTVTRNWIWDYAQNSLKAEWFWTFDDNIRGFVALNNNIKYRILTNNFLYMIEDFIMRYSNILIGGMNYDYFVPRKNHVPPFIFNTRVYSNMFIKAGCGYRNVTFYNDDTDLCLRILKDGYCTILFNAFLAKKISTQIVAGGMTDYYKKTNKRLEFARELQVAHPDVTKVVWKYNRWHHSIDYRKFRGNRPIRKEDAPEKIAEKYSFIYHGGDNV